VYCLQERYAEAEPLLTRALTIREKARGPDNGEVADTLHNLASAYRGQGRAAEAEPLLARALPIREMVLGPDDPSTKETRDALDALRSTNRAKR
jgi:tetratricopeptide (TPR) repeat protein